MKVEVWRVTQYSDEEKRLLTDRICIRPADDRTVITWVLIFDHACRHFGKETIEQIIPNTTPVIMELQLSYLKEMAQNEAGE